MALVETLFYTFIAFGVLVTFHEYGHFWVARHCNVRVEKFSIGFGKKLFSWRDKHNTEFILAALPLGGYVKMLDESEGEVADEEKHRAFNRQPLLTRTAVVVAGPLFNFLFAVLAYWVVYIVGIEGIKPVVGKVVAGSIAERAGFQEGDLMLSQIGRAHV